MATVRRKARGGFSSQQFLAPTPTLPGAVRARFEVEVRNNSNIWVPIHDTDWIVRDGESDGREVYTDDDYRAKFEVES